MCNTFIYTLADGYVFVPFSLEVRNNRNDQELLVRGDIAENNLTYFPLRRRLAAS